MTDRIECLDLDDVLALAGRLLGEPVPIRDMSLLGAAAARPRTAAFGHDAYPDLLTKGAALLQSIVKNHAHIDSDKRLGWLATAVFLELNNASVADASNDDVYNLVMRVASEDIEVADVAADLARLAGHQRR